MRVLRSNSMKELLDNNIKEKNNENKMKKYLVKTESSGKYVQSKLIVVPEDLTLINNSNNINNSTNENNANSKDNNSTNNNTSDKISNELLGHKRTRYVNNLIELLFNSSDSI